MYNSFSDSELKNRYQSYSAIAAGRDTVPLDELARRSGIPYNTMLRDLQRILQRNWFDDGAYINYLSKTLVIRVPEENAVPSATQRPVSGGASANGQYRYSYVPSAAPTARSATSPQASAQAAPRNTGAASASKALYLPKVKDINKGLSGLLLVAGIMSAMVAVGMLGDAIDWISWGDISYFFSGLINSCIAGGVSAGSFIWRNVIKKRNRRIRAYRMMQTGRTAIPLLELADANDVSLATTKKDVEKMIDAGLWGKTAYIDSRSNTLYLNYTPGTVQPAVPTAASAPAPAPTPAPQPAQPKEPPRQQPVKPDEYHAILQEIRQLNDDIADAAVSEKISRIEEITGKIFRIVAEKPEKKSEIRSFMSYYLPTTLKLLRSYRTFEKQGVSGENIENAKKDIERILDTLVVGFTQQLDQLFKNDALDISTDIEVLEQMMKKDGLAELNDDFGSVGFGTL